MLERLLLEAGEEVRLLRPALLGRDGTRLVRGLFASDLPSRLARGVVPRPSSLRNASAAASSREWRRLSNSSAWPNGMEPRRSDWPMLAEEARLARSDALFRERRGVPGPAADALVLALEAAPLLARRSLRAVVVAAAAAAERWPSAEMDGVAGV